MPKPKKGEVVLKHSETEESQRELVREAIDKKFGSRKKGKKSSGCCVPYEAQIWVEEISDDVVIFAKDDTKLAVDFSIKDGKVALGEAFPVQMQWSRL